MPSTFTAGQIACGIVSTPIAGIVKNSGEVIFVPKEANVGAVYIGTGDVTAANGLEVPVAGLKIEMQNAHLLECIGTDVGDILTFAAVSA